MAERRASSYLGWGGEARLAQAIREISAKHEASWKAEAYQAKNPFGEVLWYGKYLKTESECIREAVGEDPIAMILSCLFTAGYCEMYDFCDQVLGPIREDKT